MSLQICKESCSSTKMHVLAYNFIFGRFLLFCFVIVVIFCVLELPFMLRMWQVLYSNRHLLRPSGYRSWPLYLEVYDPSKYVDDLN